MTSRFLHRSPVIFAAALIASAFVSTVRADHHGMAKTKAPVGFTAVAVLVPGVDSEVTGKVTFTQVENGVRVRATVTGLAPGKHGFHVHEKGDLTLADLTSTGGHFNPEGHDHAGPDAPTRHVGDLGNLVADAQGNATADFVDPKLALAGEHSIIGRGVIVHAGEDDLTTQPTGDAGGRVAGGVIGVVGMP